MDRLEQDLKQTFERQVAAPPALPHLADTLVARGKRAKRRRTAATAGSVVVVVVAAFVVLPSVTGGQRTNPPTAAVTGPPRVPLVLTVDEESRLIEWVDGGQRTRRLSPDLSPVAVTPSGLLVMSSGDAFSLGILGPGADTPTVLVPDLHPGSIAVSHDGSRVTVARSVRPPTLREIELPSGRVVREIAVVLPGGTSAASIEPVAYSGEAVLVNMQTDGEGRAALWEAGDDEVFSALDGVGEVLPGGGGQADFSDDRDAVGGRAATATGDGKCPVEVRQLRDGDGSPWRLCGEGVIGFSPGGDHVLARNIAGDTLIVHDADDGKVRRTFEAGAVLRAQRWESRDTILYTTISASTTRVVRCAVSSGSCATAAEFTGTDSYLVPSFGMPEAAR